ncbi:MAG: T9SS type A sorting domain-containing protein [Sphingobacteriaceae bacterium]|nr:T9SS type A sorting domain-containing protein [Sphingobacteriaceae bacterium]
MVLSIGSVTPISPNTTVTPNYTVNCLTSTFIKEEKAAYEFTIYNNERGSYKINAPHFLSAISVYDISGKQIKNVVINDNSVNAELQLDQASGVYIVKMRYVGGAELQQKLIHFSTN